MPDRPAQHLGRLIRREGPVRFDTFVDGPGTELSSQLTYSLAFGRRRLGGTLGYISLHFPFNLRFD